MTQDAKDEALSPERQEEHSQFYWQVQENVRLKKEVTALTAQREADRGSIELLTTALKVSRDERLSLQREVNERAKYGRSIFTLKEQAQEAMRSLEQRCEALERERDNWKTDWQLETTLHAKTRVQLAAAQQRVKETEAARDLNWSFFLSEQELTAGLREEVAKEAVKSEQAQQTATYWEKLTHEYMNGAGKLERQIAALSGLITWLLGENGEFPDEPEPLAGKYRQRFWWRPELRKRYEQAQRVVGGEAPAQCCGTCSYWGLPGEDGDSLRTCAHPTKNHPTFGPPSTEDDYGGKCELYQPHTPKD